MPNIITIRNLVKRYGDLVALDHFNLSIAPGEIFGLLGPNGSGKTTAINCILQLLTYDKGEIELFGEPMTTTRYDIKRRIGVVPQQVAVFEELTVRENIDYFCSLYIDDKAHRRELVDEAIEFVSLEDYTKFRPKKLSGGLLRRLNIACGIAHKPELIFFDEPTVAVDPQSRASILDGIPAQRAGHHGGLHESLHGRSRAIMHAPDDHGPRPFPRHGNRRRAAALDINRREDKDRRR